MPNADLLIRNFSQKLSSNASQETAYLSFIDLQYTKGPLNLHREISHYCNLKIVSGGLTGTYLFKSGFNGLTNTPAEVQNAIYYTLISLEDTYCFLVDLLILSRESYEVQSNLVKNCLKKFQDGILYFLLYLLDYMPFF